MPSREDDDLEFSVKRISELEDETERLEKERDSLTLQVSELTKQRDELERVYLAGPSRLDYDARKSDLEYAVKVTEDMKRQVGDLTKRLEQAATALNYIADVSPNIQDASSAARRCKEIMAKMEEPRLIEKRNGDCLHLRTTRVSSRTLACADCGVPVNGGHQS